MGEYEPDDSRNVTLRPDEAPGEPPRTGPREGEARAAARGKGDAADDGEPKTARDATGEKQEGFASGSDDDERELQRKSDSALP